MAAETPERLRVLLGAFAIAPNQGSEPGVGWNVAIRLAKDHDVTVLCGDLGPGRQTGLVLEDYLRDHGPIAGLEICYVAPSRLTQIFHWLCGKPGLWLLYYAAYRSWQRDAFRRASELHTNKPFHLAHQVTYACYWEPGYLWRLPIPFFWGPITGAASPPVRMLLIGGIRGLVRFGVGALQMKVLLRSASAARKAARTWVPTLEDQMLIEKWGGKVEQQLEVGVPAISNRQRTKRSTDQLRLVWSGLHIHRKALPLALHALAKLPANRECTLQVLGAGRMTAQWKKLAAHLDIEHLVRWHGKLTQPDALTLMSESDALLHTSIHEGTSQVVLEALSLGLPVICHDACGMRTAVTDQCGIKVPLIDPKTSIQGFARAIESLTNLNFYNRLSAGALERARDLTWDRKVERISEVYRTQFAGPQHALDSKFRDESLSAPSTSISEER